MELIFVFKNYKITFLKFEVPTGSVQHYLVLATYVSLRFLVRVFVQSFITRHVGREIRNTVRT